MTMDEPRREHPGVYEIFMARLREKIIERTATPTIMGLPVYEVGKADPIRMEPVLIGGSYEMSASDPDLIDEIIDYNESCRIFDAFGVRFP